MDALKRKLSNMPGGPLPQHDVPGALAAGFGTYGFGGLV